MLKTIEECLYNSTLSHHYGVYSIEGENKFYAYYQSQLDLFELIQLEKKLKEHFSTVLIAIYPTSDAELKLIITVDK